MEQLKLFWMACYGQINWKWFEWGKCEWRKTQQLHWQLIEDEVVVKEEDVAVQPFDERGYQLLLFSTIFSVGGGYQYWTFGMFPEGRIYETEALK